MNFGCGHRIWGIALSFHLMLLGDVGGAEYLKWIRITYALAMS